MKNVNYASGKTPKDYVCCECGATNCKLWREYQTFVPDLKCAKCAAKEQGKNIEDIDEQGMRTGELGHRTDQIGWYVPCIPDEQGVGYWGYTSVPEDGVKWWDQLPTLPE